MRDDVVPFSQSSSVGDKERAVKAKQKKQMNMKSALVQKRGDWSWFVNAVDWRVGSLGLAG